MLVIVYIREGVSKFSLHIFPQAPAIMSKILPLTLFHSFLLVSRVTFFKNSSVKDQFLRYYLINW